MNFDRNTIIGFVAMMALLFGYIYFTQRQAGDLEKEKQRTADSIAKVEAAKKKLVDTTALKEEAVKREAANQAQAAGGFQSTATGAEQMTVVENEVMKVSFTSKGGYPKSIEL